VGVMSGEEPLTMEITQRLARLERFLNGVTNG
jgi:hypothetical protein